MVIPGVLMNRLHLFPYTLAVALLLVAGAAQAESELNALVESYIDTWAEFYPSEALSNGLKEAAWEFENFSGNRVGEWINYNRRTLEILGSLSDLSIDEQVDERVLRRQANRELERWAHDEALVNQPSWYAEVISQALTYILVREQFTPEEKFDAVLQRLPGVQSMCKLGIVNLQNGSPERTRRAVEVLERTRTFYQDSLPGLMHDWSGGKRQEQVTHVINDTVNSVDALLHHIREDVLPDASIPDRLDDQDYARKLRIYTDSDLTPDQLRDSAAAEIEEVRRLMVIEAKAWWNEQESISPMPADENELLEAVMAKMEAGEVGQSCRFPGFFQGLDRQGGNIPAGKRPGDGAIAPHHLCRPVSRPLLRRSLWRRLFDRTVQSRRRYAVLPAFHSRRFNAGTEGRVLPLLQRPLQHHDHRP